jgi:L,D-transpeptidase ErfK/SrfK
VIWVITGQQNPLTLDSFQKDPVMRPVQSFWIDLDKDIRIESYFNFVDSIVKAYDSIVDYELSEHQIVRSNPSIIDALANTDYYRMIAKDSFVYDQKKMIVLRKDDSIKIPSYRSAIRLIQSFNGTKIDVNIPEFRLRIYIDSVLLYSFPIRVGQHIKKYLAMGDRVTDLRTKTGKGMIVRHARNPEFYNPTTGEQFFVTRRDDEKVTLMPQIPWIETEINGLLNGQMIHPTTNPKTLEKAYSNGCIGTREADAWIIYYYAPIGTTLEIRYDLKVKSEDGKVYELKDIYGYGK